MEVDRLRGRRVVVTATLMFITMLLGVLAFDTGPVGAGTTAPIAVPATVPLAGAGVAVAAATRGTIAQIETTLPPPPSELPAGSGTGRRAVYSKSRQRVWVVERDGTVLRTYRVSGRYDMPNLGTFHVFSRSSLACSSEHRGVCMRFMVRFTKGPHGGNIGFHEIPRKYGVPEQTDAQLGQPLSDGCVRQKTSDARFMWGWAYVGTKVVVIA
jgi:hypothetical protein